VVTAMTETAFTLWILAAMFLGIVMGLILAHLVWSVATDCGVRPFPKIVIRWER
jgi:Na+/H+-dicarboxylate symporter